MYATKSNKTKLYLLYVILTYHRRGLLTTLHAHQLRTKSGLTRHSLLRTGLRTGCLPYGIGGAGQRALPYDAVVGGGAVEAVGLGQSRGHRLTSLKTRINQEGC